MRWRSIAGCLLAFAVTGECQDNPPGQTGREIAAQSAAVVSVFACDTNGKAVDHATGFFVSADGMLVSTRHAVEGKAKAVVQMNDGRLLDVVGVVAEDPLHDLVLLRVRGNGFPCLKPGAFDQVRNKATVWMIVDTYTLRKEAGRGILPSRPGGRSIEGAVASVNNLADDYEWFSIHMPIRRGESGSPILDESGEVIGMLRASLGDDDHAGFAVSVDYIRQLVAAPVAFAPRPLAQLQRREYDEIFDDLDFKAGLQLLNDGRYEAARRRMELAVKRFPGSGAFHVLLGSCCARVSMWDEANHEFTRAIEIKPGNAMAWASLGMTLVDQGRTAEAAGACKKAVALKSDLPDTWFNVGAIYVILKRYDEARTMLQRLRDFKTPEADEMAERLIRALELASAPQPAR